MSRVAKIPVTVPAGVNVELTDEKIEVTGPLGSLNMIVHPSVKVRRDGGQLLVAAKDSATDGKRMSGTVRANVANMIHGVSIGFERKLYLVGVGYKAQAQGDKLNLALGFSHPIIHVMPLGVRVETPTQTEIILRGIDRQKVGQVASEIRAYRAPEPYKGKGVRYVEEIVVLKETKKK